VQDRWLMPQGGIEPDEVPLAAALQEEIGTDNATVIVESPKWKWLLRCLERVAVRSPGAGQGSRPARAWRRTRRRPGRCAPRKGAVTREGADHP